MLLRNAPIIGQVYRSYTTNTKILEPTLLERTSYQELKAAFANPSFLSYYNPARDTYIDVDVLQEFGIGAIVYYIKKGVVLQAGK